MDNSLLIPVGGVAFVLLLINIRFAFSMMAAQRQRTEDQRGEIDDLKKEREEEVKAIRVDLDKANKRHRTCERVTNILIWTLQQNQIEVPETIWETEGD